MTRDQQVGTVNYMSPEAIVDTCGGSRTDASGKVKPHIKVGSQRFCSQLSLAYIVGGLCIILHMSQIDYTVITAFVLLKIRNTLVYLSPQANSIAACVPHTIAVFD